MHYTDGGCWAGVYRTTQDRTETQMAELLKLTFRGHILSSAWAMDTWWRRSSPTLITNELGQAEALCNAAVLYYLAHIGIVMSDRCVLDKVIAQGYNTPSCFYELAAGNAGGRSVDDAPTYVAMGFRQYRTNSDFRASTHRLPGVAKSNIVEGSWAYDGAVDVATMAAVTAFFRTPLEAIHDSITYGFVPVLVRTQYKPRGSSVTTYFDPPQTNDVAASAFYGLTSQVSRKVIVGA